MKVEYEELCEMREDAQSSLFKLYIKFLWKGTRMAIAGMDEDNFIMTIRAIGPMANVRPVVAIAMGSY